VLHCQADNATRDPVVLFCQADNATLHATVGTLSG